MGKMMLGSCDACGATRDLGPLGGSPLEWWSIHEPVKRASLDRFEVMACSAECALVALTARVAKSYASVDWGLTPMTAERSRIVHAMPIGISSDPDRRSLCYGLKLARSVPAEGGGLRVCKKCGPPAERLEPGWFVADEAGTDRESSAT